MKFKEREIMIIGMDRLTPSQKALIPSYIEKWDKIKNSTVPIDRKNATYAIHMFYRASGLELPQEIVFVESEKEMGIAFLAYQMKELHPDLKISDCWHMAEEAMDGNIPDNASDELNRAFIEATSELEAQLGNVIDGHEFALYEYDFAKEVCGSFGEEDASVIEAWMAIGRECGLVMPYDTVCIVSERKVRKELLNK